LEAITKGSGQPVMQCQIELIHMQEIIMDSHSSNSSNNINKQIKLEMYKIQDLNLQDKEVVQIKDQVEFFEDLSEILKFINNILKDGLLMT